MATISGESDAAGAAHGGPVPGPHGALPPPPPQRLPPDRLRSEGLSEIEPPLAPPERRGSEPIPKAGMLERLERSLFIRIGRSFFFLTAVLAMLAVLGGLGAGGMGMVEDKVPPPPEVAPASPPETVNYAQVQQILARKRAEEEAALRQAQAAPAASAEPAPSGPDVNQATNRPVTELQRQLDRLRALFPNPPYVWDDVYESYCRVPSPFGCLSTGQRQVKEGISQQVERPFRHYGPEEVVPVLQVVNEVLAAAPVGDRLDLLPIAIQLFEDSHEAYRERVRQREEQIAQAQASYQAEVSREQEKRATYRQYGMYGALGGLGLLVLVSVFLVHFSIERHLRLLRQTLEGQPGMPRSN